VQHETDYLVVGAGAAAMAFTDSILTHTSATVTIVDRRHAPGGHWVDAYPFVRLHQPSALYGVDSVPMGTDSVDAVGTNAGFYERANAVEICAYFDRVMQRHFLPTGRVTYVPCSDYAGEHRYTSRLSGDTHQVTVRKRLVDTSFLEGSIPATSPPPFRVAEGVRCITPTQLARLDRPPERVVIVGGGKTALDACVWLLEQGVRPDAIRWIRPRDGWWLNRRFQQPLGQLPDLYRGVSLQIEACARATSLDELFAQLDSDGIFLRIDPTVAPTMFHGAIVSEPELALLRTIENVVRLGRVQAIERDRIVLDQGEVPTDERTVHVHCAATGLAYPTPRPIFEPGRITVQPYFWGFACHQFALLGAIEALVDTDDEKNRLCPPMRYWDKNADYVTSFLSTLVGDRVRAAHPAVGAWMKKSRLNPTSGMGAHLADPRVVEARERIKRFGAEAAANLAKLARL
jgi:hypothetical protein